MKPTNDDGDPTTKATSLILRMVITIYQSSRLRNGDYGSSLRRYMQTLKVATK